MTSPVDEALARAEELLGTLNAKRDWPLPTTWTAMRRST